MTPRLPIEIVASPTGVVRPIALRGAYANPAKEFRRLVRNGVLLRLSHGYFAVVPEPFRGTNWRPSVEAAGLAIGQADYGRDGVVAMGITAARLLGAVPRAIGECILAISKQRPALDTVVGRIRFVTREIARLDVQRADTELAGGWVTTAEQTVLDLADRPALGNLPPNDVAEAIRLLAKNLDRQRFLQLARKQRKMPAAVRATWAAGIEPVPGTTRKVPARGLRGAQGARPEHYGIV